MSLEIFEEQQASSFRRQDAAALPMDDPLPDRYTVFLSHCGQEKPFARKLNDALRRNGLDVFFDERDLPLGEPFPEHIKLAAENCSVALVVLSGGFLSRKWPMLEAELFQASKESSKRGMKIVPLFFKVSCSDLKNEENQATWFDAWRESVRDDHTSRDRQWEKWKRIVKGLDSSSGLEFKKLSDEEEFIKKFSDEEEFIKMVVQRIRKVAPPLAKFDECGIEGKERLVQEVMQHFECDTTEVSTSRHAIVGVYGIGGTGKSTLCRLLCNEHAKQFPGKVFYLELDEARNCTGDQLKHGQLERQKYILRGLCDETSESLTAVQHSSQGWAILKQKMPHQDVFLVLDSVWESSLEEAKEYMKVRYSRRSRVLVTSRYKRVLDKVFLSRGSSETCCMAMPDLRKEEAIAVFLQAANLHESSLNGGQLSVVKWCVRLCDFRIRVNESESSEKTASLYHPLSLRVFGASSRDQGEDPSKWKIGGSNWFKQENQVFSVIGTSYEDLPVRTKQVFLDLGVFFQRESRDENEMHDILRQLYGKDVAKEVQKLRDRMILDSHGMTMHDLFIEFAEMVARTGEFGEPQSRCIHGSSSRKFSGASIERDASVLRVNISGNINSDTLLELQKYSQVEVLILSARSLKRLDVGAMKNLIYLKVSHCFDLVEVSGMGSVQRLAWCILVGNMGLKEITGDTRLPPAHGTLKHPSSRVFSRARKIGPSSLKQLSDRPFQLPNLRVFEQRSAGGYKSSDWEDSPPAGGALAHLSSWVFSRAWHRKIGARQWVFFNHYPGQFPDWQESLHLTQLSISSANLRRYLTGVQHLERLETLRLFNTRLSSDRIDLRGLTRLRVLSLDGVSGLRELAGLDTLVSLTCLRIDVCPEVRKLAGLEVLTAQLRTLEITNLTVIRRLPDLGHLTALDYLCIEGCPLVTEVLGLNKLANLCELRIGGGFGGVHVLPDVSELTKLRILSLGGQVKSVPGLEQIAGGLTDLRCSGRLLTTQVVTNLSATLTCRGAALQVEQTASGRFSSVTTLGFESCSDLTSLDYLQGLFPLLQKLSIFECPLTSLDHLQDLFPLLQELSIQGCPLSQLCKLPSTIEVLNVNRAGITSLPADLFAACSRLSSLDVSYCGKLPSRELISLWQDAHLKPKGLVRSIFRSLDGQRRQWEQISSELTSQEISSFIMAGLDDCPFNGGGWMKCFLFQEPSSLVQLKTRPNFLALLRLSTSDSTVDAPLLICKRTMTSVCENPELLAKFLKIENAYLVDILVEALASGECEEQLQMSGFHELLLQLSPTRTLNDGLGLLVQWCTILHTVLQHYPNLREMLKAQGILNVLRYRLEDVTTESNGLDEDEEDWEYREKIRAKNECNECIDWLRKCIAAANRAGALKLLPQPQGKAQSRRHPILNVL